MRSVHDHRTPPILPTADSSRPDLRADEEVTAEAPCSRNCRGSAPACYHPTTAPGADLALRGRKLAVYRGHLYGRKTGRENHLKHLNVMAVAEFAMANLGRLMDTRPRLEAHHALAFILKLNPAPQNVDQLKRGLMKMGLPGSIRPGEISLPPAPTLAPEADTEEWLDRMSR